MRKKTQAHTARLKPNASEMYSNVPIDGEVPSGLMAASASFATWAPAKAKKRKRNVPRNSPIPCDVLAVSPSIYDCMRSSYSNDVAPNRMRLATGNERWLAWGVYGIALSCVGEDDEAVVDGRLDVHGCCCFLFLFVLRDCVGSRRACSPRRRR